MVKKQKKIILDKMNLDEKVFNGGLKFSVN